ncbi:glycerophosphodiester phosphodiesterase [Nocardioides sp. 616]|uniref:glycerophosphodiester phosphodiesterase n=1 Tax=Nocardioides sp. 616 TaxID=2268090 RepID=UPI001F05FBD6|nr:glycerophosphodiester phosphodiesterase [Nocardioides sp. 616]
MTARTTRPAYLQHPAQVLAFAHRGGSYHPEIEGLENTMAAFAHAVALGYDYLETDVVATSDGVLLAFHDTVLDRVTDRTGEVSASTYAEVMQALIDGRERIPRLTDLLAAFPQVRFNIDLKTDGAVLPLVELIERHGAHDQILVGSFSGRRLRAFRRLTRGRVATSAHPLEVVLFRLLPSARLADRLCGGALSAFQVPHRRGRLRVVTPGFVRRAHAVGKHVHVWTIDDPDEMRLLLDRGVDGLMTDRTDLLKEVLRERGAWRETR